MQAPTRGRILMAARTICQDAGSESLSMRQIAGRLGLTAPALYHHFHNREAILEAISDDGFERLVARIERRLRRTGPLRQCLEILVVYREFALEEPHVFAVMFIAPRPRARRFPDDFVARRSAAFSLLADRVAAAMAAHELRDDDSNEVALTLWAHAHGLILLQRAGRFGAELALYRRAFDRSVARLVEGLASRGKDGR